jgi:hypothetical protein
MAKHWLAEEESVVRNGIAAFPSIGNPLSRRLIVRQEITRLRHALQNLFLVKGPNKGDYGETIPPEFPDGPP